MSRFEEALRAATGYAIGGVPPMGLARPLPVVMDADLLEHDVVWAAAGRPDAVFAIAPQHLRDLTCAMTVVLGAGPLAT